MQKVQGSSFLPLVQNHKSFPQPRADLGQAAQQVALDLLEDAVAFFTPIIAAIIFVFILLGTLALIR